MAGVLGFAKTKTWDEPTTDCNLALQQTIYNVRDTTSNLPDGFDQIGLLRVVTDYGKYVVHQILTDNLGHCFCRVSNNSGKSWQSWQRLDNFGYNTLAELANALKPLLGLS